jgi:hypothetical protein
VSFVEIHFQVKEEGAAGAAHGGRELRVVIGSLICCRTKRKQNFREMRCVKGRRLGKGEELALTDGGEFDWGHLQMRRSPASNLVALSQGFREGAKGEERGVRGVFKEGGGVERGLGFRRGEAMDGAEASGSGRSLSRGGRRV